MTIQSMINRNIKYLRPYNPGLFNGKYKLDANENSFDLPENIKIKIFKEAKKIEFNRYPDPYAEKLRSLISIKLNINKNNILVGNGSDELIYYLLLSFINKKDKVVVPYPTFEIYKILSEICGASVIEVPLKSGFDLDVEKMVDILKSNKIKFVFLAYPNNPTGNCFSKSAIKRILMEKDTFVVIDEAYFEFSGKTFLNELKKHKNLIILRTFSKAFSLAALRTGYMIASESIINIIKRVKLPYNINSFSQIAALNILKYENQIRKTCEIIIKERQKMKEKLEGLYYIPESDANFLFIKISKPDLLKKEFIKKGICVRFFSDVRLKNYVRITIGKSKENKLVTDILKKGF
ncbi:MAG: histidinol-phosphate transaminase [Candidatus Goldbacteria bacterium]|nr:histidinol-phosphate transaminase [Candidatus Goldiibacteriota bacterium]